MKRLFILTLMFISVHTSAQVYTFGVIADAGLWNHNARQVRNSALKSGIKRLILPGDNLYDLRQSYQDVWEHWSRFGMTFDVVALGNHHNGHQNEMGFFKMPAEFYSKQIGPIRFLVLNSDNQQNIDEQIHWLVSQLDRRSKSLFTVLVYHHPPVTISFRHGWKEREEFHRKMQPILSKFAAKIDLALVGHDHQASIFKYGDIPYVVSGAVFETFPARWVSTQYYETPVNTLWAFDEGLYWTRLDFNAKEKHIWVNFVRSDIEEVSCSIGIFKAKKLVIRDNCYRSLK